MSMTGRTRTVFLVEGLTLASVLVFLTSGISLAQTKTIIDEWAIVQAPKPPELKPVTLDPKTSALLVLDFVKQTCNTERRPPLPGFRTEGSGPVETSPGQRSDCHP